jgi:hypothetical protein
MVRSARSNGAAQSAQRRRGWRRTPAPCALRVNERCFSSCQHLRAASPSGRLARDTTSQSSARAVVRRREGAAWRKCRQSLQPDVRRRSHSVARPRPAAACARSHQTTSRTAACTRSMLVRCGAHVNSKRTVISTSPRANRWKRGWRPRRHDRRERGHGVGHVSLDAARRSVESSNVVVTVQVTDGKLMVSSSNDPRAVELLAESTTRFFVLAAQLEIEFVTSTAGAVTHIVINGATRARRLPGAEDLRNAIRR